jgi:hypothetical protein
MLNHHLSQKFKLIERDKFNHLIYILTLDPVEFLDILQMDMPLHLERMVVCYSPSVLGIEICLGGEP